MKSFILAIFAVLAVASFADAQQVQVQARSGLFGLRRTNVVVNGGSAVQVQSRGFFNRRVQVNVASPAVAVQKVAVVQQRAFFVPQRVQVRAFHPAAVFAPAVQFQSVYPSIAVQSSCAAFFH